MVMQKLDIRMIIQATHKKIRDKYLKKIKLLTPVTFRAPKKLRELA